MEELIVSYLSGNASPKEIRELEAWVLADSENKKQFMAMKKAWMLTGATNDPALVDVEGRWKQISSQLFSEAKVVPINTNRSKIRWLGLAAAIVGLLIFGLWLLRPGTSNIEFYATTDSPKEVMLSDGSKVFLNRNTSVRFEGRNASGNRELFVEGVAFLDVKRDTTTPFEVNTNSIQVRVLGTSFLVDARRGYERAEVIVKSGLVRVIAAGIDSLELTENQKATFLQEGKKLSMEANYNTNYLSFTQDSLIFDKTPLDEVAATLGRHFNVSVSLQNEELANCKIVGTFTDESLEDILKILQISHGLGYEKNGTTYVISGSCK